MTWSKPKKFAAKTAALFPKGGHVCEVGVGRPHMCLTSGFIGKDGWKVTLVDMHPKAVRELRDAFGQHDNLNLIETAISDHVGTITAINVDNGRPYNALGASFVKDVHSPYCSLPKRKLGDYGYEEFEAPCVTWDQIDDGTIDAISVDIDGGGPR